MSCEFYNVDCMEYMKTVPDKHFDLSIVDPPYGIGDTFIGYSTGCIKRKLERKHKEMEWDYLIPGEIYFVELARTSKKRIIWGANYFNCFENGGAIVWYKNRGGNTLSQCEIASVSGQKRVDYIYMQVLTGFVSRGVRVHPTQKPVALYRWLLQNYAKPGQLIFDSHVGSGSSLIACIEMGFDCVGCEIDKEYYDAASARIDEYKSQQRMFI